MNTVKTHHEYCTSFDAVSIICTSPKSREEKHIEEFQAHTRPCHTGSHNRANVLMNSCVLHLPYCSITAFSSCFTVPTPSATNGMFDEVGVASGLLFFVCLFFVGD